MTSHTVDVIAAFLGTYLIHSTLLLAPVWWLTSRRLWPGNPQLRSQLLKLSLLAPLLTTLLVTTLNGPNWGVQFAINDAAPVDRLVVEAIPEDLRRGSQRLSETAPIVNDFGELETSFLLAEPAGDATSASMTGETLQPMIVEPVAAGESVPSWWRRLLYAGVAVWMIVAVAGLAKLGVLWRNLQHLRTSATVVEDRELLVELVRLKSRFGIKQNVALLVSGETEVPLAAGIVRPFIAFPVPVDEAPRGGLGSEFSAMLSHELAHVARRDARWNLLLQVFCRVGWFQPLNWLASHSLRQQMDFCADLMAAEVLGERLTLVKCLYRAGTQLGRRRSETESTLVLASGMALFHSTLGQRVEALLSADRPTAHPRSITKLTTLLLLLLGAVTVSLLGPRAVIEAAVSPPNSDDRNDNMNKSLASILVLAGLTMPATADDSETTVTPPAEAAVLKSTADELPAGIRKFNGMLVGRVAAKDPEQGTFIVLVDAVPRVWENSQAEDPRSVVGKTVRVGGVFGKFLDVLVVTRIGETVEFECKHDGEDLVFPGELLRKVAPYDPADYPVLPEAFRGFRGEVAAEIIKKDLETFELIIRVDRVLKTWEENGAKDSKSIEGKSLMLAGFWNRREAYHDLKVGDHIEVGMRHIGRRSDHMTVAEAINRPKALSDRPLSGEDRAMAREEMEARDPQRGFRGMLVGRLVEKDAERGTFTITVDAVPRVWENNQSASPKSLIGKNVSAEGVTGRLIDALVVTKVGETIEFGALHEEGPRVRVGEVLRKVSPVQAGDYPVLPDGFRGFRGMVTAKVIRKGDELWELIVEVEQIHESFDGSRAEQPQSIVGKQVMLAGFWNRKDEFHNIRVGDRIRCGMNHTQLLSDHMTVIESIRKVGERGESD